MAHSSPDSGRWRPRRLMLVAAAGDIARLPVATAAWEPLCARHAEALGALFQAAFAGTIEDDGEVLADPVGDMRGAIAGMFGEVVGPASLAILDGAAIRAAILTVLMDSRAPLIAVCMTAPQWQRHGYATGLLRASASALASAGHDRVFLAVHPESPAHAFYRRLGFEPA